MAWDQNDFVYLCGMVFCNEYGDKLLNILKEYYVDTRYERSLMEENNNKVIWMLGQRDMVQKIFIALDEFKRKKTNGDFK
jgi:hypothetical protein